MKIQNAVWKKMLKVSLAATFAVTPFIMGASVVQADPPRHAPSWGNRDKDHKGDKDNKKNQDRNDNQTMTGQVSNVKGQQFDLRVENTTYNVYASSRLPNGLKQGDTVRVYGERSGNNDIRNANVRVIGNNNSGRWNNNKDSSNNYQTFDGQASNVKDHQFVLRVGNSTYNVYPSSRLPNGLKQGDNVRAYGQSSGNNDIRNATVIILESNKSGRWNNNGNKNRWNKNDGQNRRNNNNDKRKNHQTMTGQASNVRGQRFDLRVGTTTYNVYTSSRLPSNLKQGNTVRVYGERYGNNDIRKATVVVIGSNKKDRWNNNNSNYQTMTGLVNNVKGQEFDLRVENTTYNVYASSRLPNGLKQGDTVRVYGERSGNNDIRNATVRVLRNR